jgi:hypothetical protein
MVVAGEWEALENGRRWRMGGAGEWQARENGRRWRMAGAGERQALENGRRWRMEGKGLENFVFHRRNLDASQPSGSRDPAPPLLFTRRAAVKTHLTRNRQLLTRGPKGVSPQHPGRSFGGLSSLPPSGHSWTNPSVGVWATPQAYISLPANNIIISGFGTYRLNILEFQVAKLFLTSYQLCRRSYALVVHLAHLYQTYRPDLSPLCHR